MTLVFDISALSSLLAGDDSVVRSITAQTYDQMLVPLAADAEMRYGFAYGSMQAENLATYELFKQQFGLEIAAPNQDVAIIYAELAAWSRQHGIALSHNDIWIAATTVLVGGRLLTLDQDFQHLPQIRLVSLA
jgi:predicted nucleic acid-binding protein